MRKVDIELVRKEFSKNIKPMDNRNIPPSVIDHDICNRCGGECCKKMGCHLSPNDFKALSYETVLFLMKEVGAIAIDWWEPCKEFDDKRVYYLRMRHKRQDMIEPAWYGECVMYDENVGCLLEDAYRPMGGLMLRPSDGEDCDVLYSKKDCAKEWLEYQDILGKIVEQYYL